MAAQAGVTAGAPYHHFPNREELLRAIAEQGFERLEAALIAARDAAPADASARLEALGRTYLSFAISHPGYFRVMFHGDATSSGPTEPGLRAFHLLRDAVLACQEAGAAPAGDPTALVLRPGRRFMALRRSGSTAPCPSKAWSRSEWRRKSGACSLACLPLLLATLEPAASASELEQLLVGQFELQVWAGNALGKCAR